MDYFGRIKEALEGKLNGKELTKDTAFKELNMDSLDLVDLVFELEEDELLSIKTVNDLLTLIDSKK